MKEIEGLDFKQRRKKVSYHPFYKDKLKEISDHPFYKDKLKEISDRQSHVEFQKSRARLVILF